MGRFNPACYLVVLLLLGCQGNGLTTLDQQKCGLPALPMSSGEAVKTLVPHVASETTEVVVLGSEYFQKCSSASVASTALELGLNLNSTSWGVYELPGVAANYCITSIDLVVGTPDVEYFVALADYDQGIWQLEPEPLMGSQQLELAATDWAKYCSPGGSFYIAIIAWQAPILFEQAHFSIEDESSMPPPTGLVGTALNSSASLYWNSYPNVSADGINVYVSWLPDLSMATKISVVPSGIDSTVVEPLTNDTTYYLAITAFSLGHDAESPFSNIVEVTPHADAGTPALSGIWPRKGNLGDNRGCTSAIGPLDLSVFKAFDLAAGRSTVSNRTSPVISTSGNVYALSADGVLVCLSSDLTTVYWEFAASIHGTSGGAYLCPPQSPVLDNRGRAYFIATSPSPGVDPYLFCVDNSGSYIWRYNLTYVDPDVSMPYPTPNFTENGLLAVTSCTRHMLDGIDHTGVRQWRYDLTAAVEMFADPALSPRGTLEFPVWRSGVGVPENVIRWQSVSGSAGLYAASFLGIGVKENMLSGLIIGNDYHVYPQQSDVLLLEATTGDLKSTVPFSVDTTGSPARNGAGTHIFQPHDVLGIASTSYLVGIEVSTAIPPTLSEVFAIQLGNYVVSGQPAVDGSGTLFFADDNGTVYRAEFDPSQPIGEDNPVISDQRKFSPTDTYRFCSMAIGAHAAYIVSEDNQLYSIASELE